MNKRWVIKWNKENNLPFKPITNSSAAWNDSFKPDFAIDLDSSTRYSSKWTKDPWWSITLPRPVYAYKYRIQEPNYGASPSSAHQKTWKLFGAKRENCWEEVDYKENMEAHNSKSYIGTYEIKNHSPFIAFKILTIESYPQRQLLTFAEFDIYGSFRFHSYQRNDSFISPLIIIILISVFES